MYPDLFFSAHIRDAFSKQLRRYQTSIWPEAHASSQPGNNAVSETTVCDLWWPLLWWVQQHHSQTYFVSVFTKKGSCSLLLAWTQNVCQPLQFIQCCVWSSYALFIRVTFQANTTECTAAKVAKVSLSELCAKTWATPAGITKSAWSTNVSAIAASTAATRSAWPWVWREKVCKKRSNIQKS